MGEVRAKVAAAGVHHRARDGMEQHALGLAHHVGSQQEDPTGLVLPHAPRSIVQ